MLHISINTYYSSLLLSLNESNGGILYSESTPLFGMGTGYGKIVIHFLWMAPKL